MQIVGKSGLYAKRFVNIIHDLGFSTTKNMNILDFGCGNGNLVQMFHSLGYKNTFGCDLKFKEGQYVEKLRTERSIRLIRETDYRLPFEDNLFDVVISHQVFEHVLDYDKTLAEIKRVMSKGAVSIHKFATKNRLIEEHVKIPTASFIQNNNWLKFWISLGFRKKEDYNKNPDDLSKQYSMYLKSSVNYLSRRNITKAIGKYFSVYGFIEDLYLKNTPQLSFVYKLSNYLPFIPYLVSTFITRYIYFKKI